MSSHPEEVYKEDECYDEEDEKQVFNKRYGSIGCVLVCGWIVDNIPDAVVVRVDKVLPGVQVFHLVLLMGAVAEEEIVDAVAVGIDEISIRSYGAHIDCDMELDDRGGCIIFILGVCLNDVEAIAGPLMGEGDGLATGVIRGGSGVVIIPEEDIADGVIVHVRCDSDVLVKGICMSSVRADDGGTTRWVVSLGDGCDGDVGV